MIRTADTFKSWHSKLQLSNRKQTVIGTTVILLTLGVGVVWGSIAPISGAAIAPGIIVATGQNKTVQHLEGGIIDEILVREGETLQAGQTIIRLNQTAALANLTRMATQYDALRAIDARYLAERDGKDTIRFPADMLERKNDPATAEVLDGQEREFAARPPRSPRSWPYLKSKSPPRVSRSPDWKPKSMRPTAKWGWFKKN